MRNAVYSQNLGLLFNVKAARPIGIVTIMVEMLSSHHKDTLTFWRRNYFLLILAHPVYKM